MYADMTRVLNTYAAPLILGHFVKASLFTLQEHLKVVDLPLKLSALNSVFPLLLSQSKHTEMHTEKFRKSYSNLQNVNIAQFPS